MIEIISALSLVLFPFVILILAGVLLIDLFIDFFNDLGK